MDKIINRSKTSNFTIVDNVLLKSQELDIYEKMTFEIHLKKENFLEINMQANIKTALVLIDVINDFFHPRNGHSILVSKLFGQFRNYLRLI